MGGVRTDAFEETRTFRLLRDTAFVIPVAGGLDTVPLIRDAPGGSFTSL